MPETEFECAVSATMCCTLIPLPSFPRVSNHAITMFGGANDRWGRIDRGQSRYLAQLISNPTATNNHPITTRASQLQFGAHRIAASCFLGSRAYSSLPLVKQTVFEGRMLILAAINATISPAARDNTCPSLHAAKNAGSFQDSIRLSGCSRQTTSK